MSRQRLETGWGPQAPPGDNLLQAILENFARTVEHWPEALGGRVARLPDVSLADHSCASQYFNAATLLRPVIQLEDPVLDEIASFYGTARTTAVTIWSAWPTPDLSPRGWQLLGHPPLMLLPAGASLPHPPGESTANRLRVERLQGAEGAALFERGLIEGYPLEELLPYRAGALLDPRALKEPFRCWAGFVGEQPVAVASAYATEEIVGVEWVATLPEFRRRGFGAALTWTAAKSWPGKPAYLLASDEGRKIYERIGFLPLFRFTLWRIPPSSRSAGTGR
jgi:GNAT superfamily N-acetyltransferase